MRTSLAAGCVALALCAALVACTAVGADGDAPTSRPTIPTTRPFAVIELFTSEGCSSCPPADALLAKLADESSARTEAQVVCLAYHVDYWDSLGWKDAYASAAFTKRQSAYASAADSSQLYTPQMVVNGQPEGFVGSHERAARDAIAAALREPPRCELTAHVVGGDAPGVEWRVAADAPDADLAGATLDVLVVQRDAESAVRRGENAGRQLRHRNVVRSIATTPLTAEHAGRTSLPGNGGSAPGDGRFVVVLLRDAHGRVRAVTQP